MPIRQITLRILGDSRSARAEMDWVNKEADKLGKRKVTVDIEANTPQAKLEALRLKLEGLRNLHAKINVDVDDKASQLAFARINQQLLSLDRRTVKPKISVEGLARAQADLAAADLGFSKLMRSVDTFSKDAETQSNRLTKLFTPGGGFGRFGVLFGGKFALFGGIAAIGTLHLLVDAIAEVLAVVIPATVALGAFGIAGADAARGIFHHMQNLHIVMDATNRVIKPMTGNMEKLHEAVRPAVYQIFGDALTIMNSKTGIFTRLATGTAGVLTHLAARMTVAINSGHGFGEFLKNAVPDVAKLGDAFGNLFGIIGNILHVMPGYANVLLSFGDAVLKLGEWVSKVAQPLIGMGLAVHGFIVWAGLGASAVFFMSKALVILGKTAVGAAIKSLGVFIADLATTALTAGFATAATEAFSAVLASMTANPLIWIGAAIGGIAALVFWMNRSKSATQAWGDTLQKTIDNAATISQGFKLNLSALESTTSRLNAAQIRLNHTNRTLEVQNFRTGQSMKVVSPLYTQAQADVRGLTDQQRRFAQEQQFSQGRLAGLTRAYHGQRNAMALLNAAGVTQQEWQDRSAEGWAIITQKINGTIAGYKAMGQTQGTLANDLQVMDRGITDQYQAMQKLNQAWDQFIGDVTGTQGAFDTSALGLLTLAKNFSAAAKAGNTTSHTLGEVHSKVNIAHAAIDGLNQSSLSLNQAFTEQIVNTNSLIDTWRTAGISNNLFTRGVKDSIAPLVRYARGSKEATGQLITLAQEAGYNGPNSMKTLIKWLGNTHNAIQTVKHITNQATAQEALLTGSMDAQARSIASNLTKQLDAAIIKYGGVTKAVDAYARAIANQGKTSDAARSARKRLIDDLIRTGDRAHWSDNKIAGMIATVLHIPLSRALKLVLDGKGEFKIGQVTRSGVHTVGINGLPPLGRATGGVIRGPGSETSDSIPTLLSDNEFVQPAKSHRYYGTAAMEAIRQRRAVVSFAEGGPVQRLAAGGAATLTGNMDVLSGKYATDNYNKFSVTFANSMLRSMTLALRRAEEMAGGSGAAIVRDAMHYLGKIPYIMGGNSLSSGIDCSGFVQKIYGHHGISAPRTSETQAAWVRKSPPIPGGLAFYTNPQGGPPPGHVAIIGFGGNVISQGGPGSGPTLEGLHGPGPLMFTGIPRRGFGGGGAGGNLPIHGGVQAIAHAMAAARGWTGNQWNALNSVEMREAGWRLNARNPSSGAYGIAQFINGPGEYYQYGGNPNTAIGQVRAFLNYVGQRYDNPLAAWRHEQRYNWYGKGTPGAAPGWAWVGERGPELVNMRGGEQVLDSPTSILVGAGVAKGFAGGTEEHIRGLSLIKAFLNDHTRHQFQHDLHHFIKVIGDYYGGHHRRWRDDMVRRQTHHLEEISHKLDHVRNTIKHELAYKNTVFGNLKGYGDLSGLNLGPTAGIGDNVALSGGQGLSIQLSSKISNMKQFIAALRKLHSLGLPNFLFRQIVDMGPDQGLEYANELISGGGAFIKKFSAQERTLTHFEHNAARGAASAVYGDRFTTSGKAFWHGIQTERHHLEVEFRHLGRVLGEEAAKWFHVPRHGRHRRPRGFASGGILREPVWGIGISGSEYTFGESGDEFFAPMRAPGHVRHHGGGDTYNIYVNGDTDPDAAAMRIIQKIRDFKRHHGNQSTGIG